MLMNDTAPHYAMAQKGAAGIDSEHFVRAVGLVVLRWVRVVVLVNDTAPRNAMALEEDAGAAVCNARAEGYMYASALNEGRN